VRHGTDSPKRLCVSSLRTLAEGIDVSEEAILLWMAAPSTWWTEDSRPVDHLDDPEGVLAAFESHYGSIW